MKNYSLALLDDDVSARDKTGEVGTVLSLNQAERFYLIEDAASVANGVEVLIGVTVGSSSAQVPDPSTRGHAESEHFHAHDMFGFLIYRT